MSDYVFRFLPYTIGKKGLRRFDKRLEFIIKESYLKKVMTEEGYNIMWGLMREIMMQHKPAPCSEINIPIRKDDIEIWFRDRKIK